MRKLILSLLLSTCSLSFLYSQGAQALPKLTDNSKVFTTVEQPPKFNGDFYKYLAENIKYPVDAKTNKIEGTVYVSFIIEKDGSITGAKIVKGVNVSLDAEAIRVISKMPNWKSGTQGGQPVRVQYNVPIKFEI